MKFDDAEIIIILYIIFVLYNALLSLSRCDSSSVFTILYILRYSGHVSLRLINIDRLIGLTLYIHEENIVDINKTNNRRNYRII